MSKKFEKIELIVSLETYLEKPLESTVSALDIILQHLDEDIDLDVISFKQPIDLELKEIKKKRGVK